MCIAEIAKPWRTVKCERVPRLAAQIWARQWLAIVGEADEALVEGCVPEGRE